jgi:regulator of replication initiation timing
LLQKYEEEIASLKQRIESLDDEVRKLNKENDKLSEKLNDFVEFVKKQGLVNDFIEFIQAKQKEDEITKIKEDYGFEEDC